MNFTFDESTGKGYVQVQEGESTNQLSDLLVNLHFDDAGVLIGIEIIPKTGFVLDVSELDIMRKPPVQLSKLMEENL
jgi:hypothetical protein